MKLFADTSDPDLIGNLYARGIIEGVTTNPTTAAQYMKKAGGTMRSLVYEIAQRAPVPVSVECIGCGPKERYDPRLITWERLFHEGERVLQLAEELEAELWVKMPTVEQGIKAAYMLVEKHGERAKINSTLGFDFMQATRAAEAGAHVYSLFMGRMQAAGEDAVAVARSIIDEYNRLDLTTGFLAASMREPELILRSWRAGADIATAPPDILEQLKEYDEFQSIKSQHPQARNKKSHILLKWFDYDREEFKHPLLQKGLEKFVSDAASVGYDLLG